MKGLGMSYPIQDGQQGYFEQTYDTLQNEKVKLINLINTIEGERFMQPSLGLAIRKYLFEQITPDISKKIENDIRRKVSFWLPNLILNNVYIDIATDVDRNTIDIELDFSLVQNPQAYDVVSFTFTANQ